MGANSIDHKRDEVVQKVAGGLVQAIREQRSGVVFVRVDSESARDDAEASLVGLSDQVQWVPVMLEGSPDPFEALRSAQSTRRTILLVRGVRGDALPRLEGTRDRFDEARLRAVFFVSPGEARTFGRFCPSYWSRRDAYVAWPTPSSTAESDAPTHDDPQGLVLGSIQKRVDAALAMPKGAERGHALFHACRDAFLSGDVELPAKHLIAAISELKRGALNEEVAESLRILGVIAEIRGDFGGAFDWYKEAIRFWQQSENAEGLAAMYTQVGSLHYKRQEIDGAGQYLRMALDLEESLGSPQRLCDAYRRVGMVREREGNFDDAEMYFDRSEKIAVQEADDARLARILHHRAHIKERRESWSDARDLYMRSLQIKEGLKDWRGAAATLHQLGNVHLKRSEYDLAIQSYERAIQLERRSGDTMGLATSLLGLAHVAEERFDQRRAYKALLEARPILRQLHSQALTDCDKRLKRVATLLGREEMATLDAEVQAATGLAPDKPMGMPGASTSQIQERGAGAPPMAEEAFGAAMGGPSSSQAMPSDDVPEAFDDPDLEGFRDLLLDD